MSKNSLPTVSVDQRRILLQRMAEISPIDIDDRAGRAAATLAAQMLDDDVEDRPIVVLAGNNDNGTVGLVAARYLLDGEAWVQVVLATEPEHYTARAATELARLQAMDAPLAWAEEGWELPPADLVIDALIEDIDDIEAPGISDLIQLANSSLAPILSLSTPSGVNPDSGECLTPHIRADVTLMVALPRVGLMIEPARGLCGDRFLADIGVPSALYDELGVNPRPTFAEDGIIRLS